MDRRVAWIATAAMLATLLLASVATSGGVGLWISPPWEAAPLERQPVELDISADVAEPIPPEQEDQEPIELPAWLDAIIRVVMTTALLGLIIALVVTGWQRRPRLRLRRPSRGVEEFEVLPDVAAAIVDEATAQRATLLDGSPRNAIVRCWLRLEHDLAAVGLDRNPAETSAEFTERALTEQSVDPAAIRNLAALYREARFSRHELGESARIAALDALERLHEELRIAGSDPLDAEQGATP